VFEGLLVYDSWVSGVEWLVVVSGLQAGGRVFVSTGGRVSVCLVLEWRRIAV